MRRRTVLVDKSTSRTDGPTDQRTADGWPEVQIGGWIAERMNSSKRTDERRAERIVKRADEGTTTTTIDEGTSLTRIR